MVRQVNRTWKINKSQHKILIESVFKLAKRFPKVRAEYREDVSVVTRMARHAIPE